MTVTTDNATRGLYLPHNDKNTDVGRFYSETTRQASELRFTVICLCIGLFGNRFGIKIGGSYLSLVAPATLVFAVLAFMRGNLRFHKIRSAIFLLLCSLTLVSVAVQMIQPDRFAVGFSLPSLIQFIIITVFTTVCFTDAVDDVKFYCLVNAVFAVIAVFGIIQFLAQFIGLSMFSFKNFLPDSLNYEIGYHVEIPIGDTKYLKSNGFFLLEPSIFSQYMALALCIEILVLTRIRYIILLFLGVIVSLSGTGWIILGSFVLTIAIGMKTRGLVLALATVGLLGGTLAVLAVAAPDVFALFWGRVGEFGAPGSSAHDRFIAPFWALQDVMSRAPWAPLAGIGAGAGGRLTLITYEFSQNTPVKLMIEFGAPVMLTYTALLIAGAKTRIQGTLLVPAMVMILFTGENAQLPPVLYPVLLIVCIPTLKTLSGSGKR